MKKILSIMLLAAATLATSCDKSDSNTDSFKGDKYSGTLDVTMPAMMGGSTTSQDDVTFYFDEENDLATVSMAGICFTTNMNISVQMPSLDIVLPNIPESTTDDVYTADSITATAIDGQPFADTTIKSITNVVVVDSELSPYDKLRVAFDCTVAIDMTGSGSDTEITFSVEYIGYEI